MSAKLQVEKYFEALQRLVDRGEKINNDTVALEAGSGRGSIKRSRPAYAKLIVAIDIAAQEQAATKAKNDPVPALRQENANLVKRLDGALERELALLSEVYNLREEVRQLREQLSNKTLVAIHAPRNPRAH
jgi:septal ring factor EnvC (AmiA/AmiB activator)